MKKSDPYWSSLPEHDPGDQSRLRRMMAEFQEGFAFLKPLKKEKVVSIFGSHLDKENDKEYQQARWLGQKLAQNNFVVITGGGPGIMEAANRGAAEAQGKSLGITLEFPNIEQSNAYMQKSVSLHYLFVRKVILAHAAQAYVFFPGGFGTLDEFFEISTLISTRRLHEKIPVILVGRGFWQSLKNWLEKVPMKRYQTIVKEQFSFWQIVADEKEAFRIVAETSPHPAPRHDSV